MNRNFRIFVVLSALCLAVMPAYAQWAASASGSTTAAAEINAKTAWQLGAAAPTSVACTAGKDLYFDTTHLVSYWCSTSGSPGTWTAFGTSGFGYIPLPAGGELGGSLVSVWDQGPYHAGMGSTAPYMFGVQLTNASGNTPTLYATFPLPADFGAGGSVDVDLSTFDGGGNSPTVAISVYIGCYTDGSSYASNPSWGTAMTFSYTQGANSLADKTATGLNIPAGCTARKMARVRLQRTDTSTGDLGMLRLGIKYTRQ